MKKNILLILTFIISFILLIDNAYAAKELTCRYYAGTMQQGVIMSQDKNGKRTYWQYGADLNIQYACNIESTCSETFPIKREQIHVCNSDNNGCHVETVDTLNSCPKYINYEKKLIAIGGKYGIYVDYSNTSGGEYTKLNKDLSSEKVTTQKDITNKKIWKMDSLTEEKKSNMLFCKYGNDGYHDIEFYIDENTGNVYSTLIGVNGDSCKKYYIKFTKYTFKQYFNQHIKDGGCPTYIYRTGGETTYGGTVDANGCSSSATFYYYISEEKAGSNAEAYILIESNIPEEEKPKIEINSCSDLFGPDLVEEINKVMDIIRIVVPILLIIFGIVDFFKATFDNNEDEMKKDRERFIKRIIAAIIVFLVPIFVNLVLTLGNTVWSNINADTCINETGVSEEE